MGWFTKNKTPIDYFALGVIPFNGVEYPLDYVGDSAGELDKIEYLFSTCITEEIVISTKVNNGRPEHMLFHQLSLTSPRLIATPMVLDSLSRVFMDTITNRSAARFIDTIQLIQMTVDRSYLLTLKGRFLATVRTPTTDDSELLLSEELWSYAFDRFPWLYLLPIFIKVVCMSKDVHLFYRSHTDTPVHNA